MDVHPPKNGIIIGIDPYPHWKKHVKPRHFWSFDHFLGGVGGSRAGKSCDPPQPSVQASYQGVSNVHLATWL